MTKHIQNTRVLILFISLIAFSSISRGQDAVLYSYKPVSAETFQGVPDPSALRLQNRFYAGFDLAITPSFTKTDVYLTRSHVSFRIGYRIKQNLLSGSLGVEFADEKMFMPVTFEYKRYFGIKEWAPFAFLESGVSWHLSGNMDSHYNTSNYSQYAAGLFLTAGIGYSYMTVFNEFYFSIGYSYRSFVETYYVAWDETQTDDESMNGISITVGLAF
ncbi:MAG: hypothetical protein E4G95_00210 [Bacteroidia bacterium]|nr:MAG: hypothetical protein E4G95_00210 [Bacteroidia bacterium]